MTLTADRPSHSRERGRFGQAGEHDHLLERQEVHACVLGGRRRCALRHVLGCCSLRVGDGGVVDSGYPRTVLRHRTDSFLRRGLRHPRLGFNITVAPARNRRRVEVRVGEPRAGRGVVAMCPSGPAPVGRGAIGSRSRRLRSRAGGGQMRDLRYGDPPPAKLSTAKPPPSAALAVGGLFRSRATGCNDAETGGAKGCRRRPSRGMVGFEPRA